MFATVEMCLRLQLISRINAAMVAEEYTSNDPNY
jgi:hypothetical protein